MASAAALVLPMCEPQHTHVLHATALVIRARPPVVGRTSEGPRDTRHPCSHRVGPATAIATPPGGFHVATAASATAPCIVRRAVRSGGIFPRPPCFCFCCCCLYLHVVDMAEVEALGSVGRVGVEAEGVGGEDE